MVAGFVVGVVGEGGFSGVGLVIANFAKFWVDCKRFG